MRLIAGNNLVIESPSKEIKEWARKELIIPNPEYAKKVRMNFWTGNTPRTLALYETRGESLVIPFGMLGTLVNTFSFDSLEKRFPPVKPVDYGPPVPLYDYQEAAVEAMHRAQYGILQSPAGSGKTQMGIALVKRFGRTALWLTHTKDLLTQSRDRALMYMDESLIGTITEGKVNIGKGITFATIQTMCKLDLSQYHDLWDVVIVDECHRAAGTPTSMTLFYKVLNSLNARHKFGLSATVHRADGMIVATYALLGQIAYAVAEESVQDRVMNVGIKTIGTGTRLSTACLNTDGTLNYTGMITYLCGDTNRNLIISMCIEGEKGHPSLILSDRVEHLERLMALLPGEMRDKAVMITGRMTTKAGKAERESAIQDMREGRKLYLFATYSLAKEGLDIPCLERLFMATPQKDYAIVTQSIGRIARVSSGKTQPIAYDFVDNIGYLIKSWKNRRSVYKKNRCYLLEDET